MSQLLLSQDILEKLQQRADELGLTVEAWLANTLEAPQPNPSPSGKNHWASLANAAFECLIVTRNRHIIEANQACVDMIGWSYEELIGKHTQEFVAIQDHPSFYGEKEIEENQTYRIHLIHKDGTQIPAEIRMREINLNGENARVLAIRDMREMLANQQTILNMNERLNLALDSTLTGIWEWTIEGNQVIWSEGVERIMGLEVGQYDGTYGMYLSLIHPDDKQHVQAVIQKTVQTMDQPYYVEHRLKNFPDRWVLARGKVVRNERGDAIRLIGIVEDISERKQIEIAQQQREILIQRHNEAITELASHKAIANGDWEASIHEITRITCKTMQVGRVSIWLYDTSHEALNCEILYDNTTQTFTAGQQLAHNDYWVYFEHLRQNRIIVANDARTDPVTYQFAESYFKPNDIYSLIDAPIRVHGEMVGVVCCEEVGAPCIWTLDDQHFVATIGDLVALALEGYERKNAEDALKESKTQALEFQGYLKALHEATIELASIDNLNAFYRRAIEIARESLGFDRIGLLLIDETQQVARGTWGIDEFGNLRDERALAWDPDTPELKILEVIRNKERSRLWENVPLTDKLEFKGTGWVAMAVMWQGDRGIGWLSCDNLIRQEPFKPYQLDLLTLYAASLGNLINLKQGETALKSLIDRLRILQEVDHAILRAETLERTSKVVLEPLKHLIGCDYAAVWVIDNDRKTAVPVAHTNSAQLPDQFSIDDFYHHHWENLQRGDLLSMDDLSGFPLAIPFKQLLAFGVRSVKVIPMRYNDELVGTLALGLNHPGKLSFDSIQTGREVASHLAVALRQAWLYQQVQDYAEHLEKMVEERTAQVEEKASEMEAFTYSVSHDLRAPLRAINGFSLLLQESYGDLLPEKGGHYLGRIQNNAKRMGALIDDLLALSRIGRREMHLQMIDPTNIILEIIEELRANDQLANASIHVDNLPHCAGDPVLLKQAYTNLITNAIKYAKKDIAPIISIGSQAIEHGKTVYFVKDNGIGFDMQYADKLFGVFQRLHGEEYEGTGIGLATVRRIISRHGGRIWADAKVDGGATFYFILSQDNTE